MAAHAEDQPAWHSRDYIKSHPVVQPDHIRDDILYLLPNFLCVICHSSLEYNASALLGQIWTLHQRVIQIHPISATKMQCDDKDLSIRGDFDKNRLSFSSHINHRAPAQEPGVMQGILFGCSSGPLLEVSVPSSWNKH